MSLSTAYEKLPAERRHRLHDLRDRVEQTLSARPVMIFLTVVPVLVLFTFINVFPILWAISGSFFEIGSFQQSFQWVGLSNYQSLFADPEFWSSLWLSFVFAGGSTAVQVVFGVALALLIGRSFKFAKPVRAIIFLPYLVPTAIFGILALWMANSSWGIINWILIDANVVDSPVPWFSSKSLAMVSLIFANSWKFTIFVTIMVVARIQSIPDGYYEAARVSGANRWQTFRDITIPNLKGVLFIVVLLRGIWMFLKFDIIWVTTRGGPDDATQTAAVYAFRKGFLQFDLGTAAAVSTVLFGILVMGALLYFYVLEPEEEVRVE